MQETIKSKNYDQLFTILSIDSPYFKEGTSFVMEKIIIEIIKNYQ